MPNISQSTITFTVLHTEGRYIDGLGLAQLADACARGDMIGGNLTVSTKGPLSPLVLQATAKSLGSDASFFGDNLDGEYDNPAALTPAWSPEHALRALMEGWNIMYTPGSLGGDWQVQRMDDNSDVEDGAQLADDDEAMLLVANGAEDFHAAARAFLLAHNEAGFVEVMSSRGA
jgi:hypothetical protein